MTNAPVADMADEPDDASHWCIIELLRPTQGHRFECRAGFLRKIRWSDTTPRAVKAARNSEAVDFGGASVDASGYRVLYDGIGWDGAARVLPHARLDATTPTENKP